MQAVTSDEWGQAYPNLPVGPGDRIFSDSDGRAEIQVGQTYIRIGPNSDVTLVDDSTFNIHVGIAQGSIRLHSFGLWPRQLLDISTPNGNAEFANSGDLRVDVLPNDGATVFTNLGQFADITAAGDFRQQLDYGQSLELAGSNPVYPQWLQPAGPDALDSWSQQRDQQLARAVSYQYASPEIPGVADLDAHGDWQPQTEYGAVWFPRDVPADWQPYRYGHWINRPPWGWVWVEDESWGYAPFHYGRWVNYNSRWGWVPGPVNVRPVWSPALVVFAGGVHFGGDANLSVWFPLGPGEAYRPGTVAVRAISTGSTSPIFAKLRACVCREVTSTSSTSQTLPTSTGSMAPRECGMMTSLPVVPGAMSPCASIRVRCNRLASCSSRTSLLHRDRLSPARWLIRSRSRFKGPFSSISKADRSRPSRVLFRSLRQSGMNRT